VDRNAIDLAHPLSGAARSFEEKTRSDVDETVAELGRDWVEQPGNPAITLPIPRWVVARWTASRVGLSSSGSGA
jgi:hypothetical protein